MAADGTALLGPNSFAFAFAFTSFEDDAVEEELGRRRDRDASDKKKTDGDAPAKKRSSDAGRKRGRDGGLGRGEESDEARGWSSAVVERGLALRRRVAPRPAAAPVVAWSWARSRGVATTPRRLGKLLLLLWLPRSCYPIRLWSCSTPLSSSQKGSPHDCIGLGSGESSGSSSLPTTWWEVWEQ